MKEKSSTFERRIEMYFFIANCGETTVTRLSNYFSVCRDTVLRDIDALSRYAPIYTKSGMYGGVFIVKDWRTGLLLPLSNDEEKFLIELTSKLDKNEIHYVKNILHKYSKNKLDI